uniref:Uncharacterized protein n=1 Tax=Arundo donax TaxID=35708 RepID=A0A0A9ASF9_ARUDO
MSRTPSTHPRTPHRRARIPKA